MLICQFIILWTCDDLPELWTLVWSMDLLFVNLVYRCNVCSMRLCIENLICIIAYLYWKILKRICVLVFFQEIAVSVSFPYRYMYLCPCYVAVIHVWLVQLIIYLPSTKEINIAAYQDDELVLILVDHMCMTFRFEYVWWTYWQWAVLYFVVYSGMYK